MSTKILAITHIYPGVHAPLRGPYNHSIFKAIAGYGDVRVVAPEPWWQRLHRPMDLWRAPYGDDTGLATIRPTYWSIPRLTALHARGMYYSLRSTVARLRRDFPFDVILAAWAYPDAVAAAMLARDYDCPFVIKVLGSDVNVLTQVPSLRRQILPSMRSAYCTIAVSGALRDRLIDLGVPSNLATVQHNGVNGERFTIRDRTAARSQLELESHIPMICYVGRLGHEKGLDILVNAMHHLKISGHGDIELNLVGWGECEAALREQVSKLQLERQVHFRGSQSHKDVPVWISASDMLCLPSRREGCPNVILEALASGRPVVATDVGGIPELVNAQNGILVPAEDHVALANALAAAFERTWDPVSLRDTVEFLSWDAVGAKYYQKLVEALQTHRSSEAGVMQSLCERA